MDGTAQIYLDVGHRYLYRSLPISILLNFNFLSAVIIGVGSGFIEGQWTMSPQHPPPISSAVKRNQEEDYCY